MIGNARRIYLGVMAALVGGCSLAAPGNHFQDYGPFAQRSDGTGELSTGIYTVAVATAGVLEVSYLAPRSHCSSLKMHFLVDGVQKAVSGEIAPGHSSGFVDVGPVEPGEHLIGLQAEGIVGGCNSGYLVSWGGSATAWTSRIPASDHPPIDGLEVGCGGGLVGSGWTVSVHADGTVARRTWRYPPQPAGISHLSPERVQSLFESARTVDFDRPQTQPIPDGQACSLRVWAGGNQQSILIDTTVEGLNAKSVPAGFREVVQTATALARGEVTDAK